MKDDYRENGEDIGKKPSQKKQAQNPKDPGHLGGALRSLFDSIKDRDAAAEQRAANEEDSHERSEAEDAAYIDEQFRNNPLPHEIKDSGPAYVPEDRVGTAIPMSDKQIRQWEESQASERARAITRSATDEARKMEIQAQKESAAQRERDYGPKKDPPAKKETLKDRLLRNLTKSKDKDKEHEDD